VAKEKPSQAILGIDEAQKAVDEHFKDQVLLLRDLADYGSNLVLRSFNSSDKQMGAMITCGVLLKQIVAMLDAIHILASVGAVRAAFLPARAAFEASIYLDWMLFSDTEKKPRYYMVSNYRDERLWANRTIKGTSEEKAFSGISASLGFDIHARRPTLAADAAKHLKEVNKILAQNPFIEIDKEFEKRKQQSSRKHEPTWHSMCGAQSIRQIARTVDRLPEYELFYAKGSRITHSASYKDHLRFAKGKMFYKHVRQLESVNELLNFVVVLTLTSYRHTLMQYRPREIQAFSRKYLGDWRGPFLAVKSVAYQWGGN